MKSNPILECIDRQLIRAIDIIRETHRKHKIKPPTDSSIGRIIYTNNYHVVLQVREGKKHIPHLAVVAFAKHYQIDMNYFYNEDLVFHFDLEDGMPLSTVGQKSREPLRQHIEKKLTAYIETLADHGVVLDDKSRQQLFSGKDELIKVLEGFMIKDARKILNNWCDVLFDCLKGQHNAFPDDRQKTEMPPTNVALYESIIEANRIAIEAKAAEIETLKKYIAHLEK
ncbi:hypothetical protein [Aquimarina pacifica]|uniref:hypothetical protein n=1 Tax=Aquimarina pacifica TaxID=1296415 RepID=UPI00047240DF|nr:hypothetical protein [Aquimarina pacifica]